MSLAERAARLLDSDLARSAPLSGGDLSHIVRIELADGTAAVVKGGPSPRAEAAMLLAIAEAGAPAPAVLAADDEVLVLEVLPADGSLSQAWGHLGEVLRRLHGTLGTAYGWREDYAFGPVAIANGWMDLWPTFWAERRLLCHCPHVDSGLARRLETLAARLADLLPGAPAASLLHGDLWTGNILAHNGRVSGLIDPACYFGHREVDLAMLTLFGSPSPAFYEAYGPLEEGYDERRPIYQLWPALVHVRLFGAGYRPMVEVMLRTCGV